MVEWRARMAAEKKIDKRMEAETIVQLKHMLEMELRRIQEANQVDMIMFVGIDGRIFASLIPQLLDGPQFRLLNLVKGNLTSICSQLKAENLTISIQQYKDGSVIISGVGDNCFLVSVFSKPVDIKNLEPIVTSITKGSAVMNHLFEQKPITPETTAGYDDDVIEELSKLTRLLFVEKFDETREYKRNMELLTFLKKKIGSVVGIGAVDEIVTVTLNELGTTPAYMKDKDWLTFIQKVIDNHIAKVSGDIVADECRKTWISEIERKLKSFV
jgi:predicted regulator of Ras-like GTPase activity (Roadblock/LC7/MglB family)